MRLEAPTPPAHCSSVRSLAGSALDRRAEPAQAPVFGPGEMQRQHRQRADLVEHQRHDAAVRPRLIIKQRQLDRAQDELAQQRRDGDDTALPRQRRRNVGADIKRAHRHIAPAADRMLGLRRHPDGAVRRHHPGALARPCHHHPLGGEDQLPPAMAVRRDAVAVGEVLGHGGDRPRHVLVVLGVGAAQGHRGGVRFSIDNGRLARAG